MGVRIRLSRNTSMYVPFWIAIPAWLIVAAGWLLAAVILAAVWLIVNGSKLAGRGITSGTAAIGRRRGKEG